MRMIVLDQDTTALTVEPLQRQKPNKQFVAAVLERSKEECRARLHRAVPQRLRRLKRASSSVVVA
jgi:hypothetical protein